MLFLIFSQHLRPSQAVPLDIPRLGDEKAQQDILAQDGAATAVGIAMPCLPSPIHHHFYGWYI